MQKNWYERDILTTGFSSRFVHIVLHKFTVACQLQTFSTLGKGNHFFFTFGDCCCERCLAMIYVTHSANVDMRFAPGKGGLLSRGGIVSYLQHWGKQKIIIKMFFCFFNRGNSSYLWCSSQLIRYTFERLPVTVYLNHAKVKNT